MHRRQALKLALYGAATVRAVAQVKTTDPIDAEAYAVGKQLMCQCGCGSTVADCNMLYCHFGEPVRQEIREGLVAGLAPQAIIDKLVAQYGEIILAAPKAEGFGAFAWTMPFVVVLAGFAAIPFVIRRWRANQLAEEAAAKPVDPNVLEKFRAEIDRDLAAEE